VVKVLPFGSDGSGVSYYRLFQPLREALRQNLCECRSVNDRWLMEPVFDLPWDCPFQKKRTAANRITYDELARWGQIICTTRHLEEEPAALVRMLSWRFGIPWVLDVDDDIFRVQKANPMYDVYRKRSVDEAWKSRTIQSPDEIKPGELCFQNEGGGLVAVARKERDAWTISRLQILDADAMTVSTPYLAKEYGDLRREAGKDPRPVYVLPNSINLREWDLCPPGPEHPGEVWVGWQGGASHPEDLDIVVPVIQELLAKHRNVKFFWTNLPQPQLLGLAEKWPMRCVFLQGWTPIERYMMYYATLNFDIALAPLTRDRFNFGKSNLKWIEAGARRQACVCSNVGPYAETIRSGKDGFLCAGPNEWFHTLDRLVRERSLRDEVGRAARARVEAEYGLEKNVRERMQVYEEIVRMQYDRCQERAKRLAVEAAA
jgi:glycosyltransferase involved in cell wall biosynthesis